MDWIRSLQKAIDYVEEHITDKNDDSNYTCEIWIAVNEK